MTETTLKKTEITVKANDSRYEYIRFLCNATTKEGARYVLQYILVDNGKFVATDGKRLHIIETNTDYLEDGLYEIVKKTKPLIILKKTETGGIYPKYQEILKYGQFETIDMNNSTKSIAGYFTDLYRMTKDSIYNPDYVSEAYLDDHIMYKLTIHGDTSPNYDRPIRIDSESCNGSVKAVRLIMPCIL